MEYKARIGAALALLVASKTLNVSVSPQPAPIPAHPSMTDLQETLPAQPAIMTMQLAVRAHLCRMPAMHTALSTFPQVQLCCPCTVHTGQELLMCINH